MHSAEEVSDAEVSVPDLGSSLVPRALSERADDEDSTSVSTGHAESEIEAFLETESQIGLDRATQTQVLVRQGCHPRFRDRRRVSDSIPKTDPFAAEHYHGKYDQYRYKEAYGYETQLKSIRAKILLRITTAQDLLLQNQAHGRKHRLRKRVVRLWQGLIRSVLSVFLFIDVTLAIEDIVLAQRVVEYGDSDSQQHGRYHLHVITGSLSAEHRRNYSTRKVVQPSLTCLGSRTLLF